MYMRAAEKKSQYFGSTYDNWDSTVILSTQRRRKVLLNLEPQGMCLLPCIQNPPSCAAGRELIQLLILPDKADHLLSVSL